MQKINMGDLDIEYNSKFNTNLENLAIENELLNPPFDNNITNYTVEVSNNKTNIQMLAIPENEKAKIQITGLGQLKEGDNLIKVTVISENESARKDYNINVHRRNIDEEGNYENMQKKNEESLNQIYNANPQIISGADYTAEKTRSLNVEKKNTNNISDAYIIGLILFLIITIILINVLTKNKKR